MGLLVVELRPKGEALGFDLDWEAKRAAALRAADDRKMDLAAVNEAIFLVFIKIRERWEILEGESFWQWFVNKRSLNPLGRNVWV